MYLQKKTARLFICCSISIVILYACKYDTKQENKIDTLSDVALSRLLKRNNIFAKLSPIQKARIVRVLKQNGNVVGYMGDGINDSPALTNSDVGISVDTAVDIAKETADIILLEKDLNVLFPIVECSILRVGMAQQRRCGSQIMILVDPIGNNNIKNNMNNSHRTNLYKTGILHYW